MTARPSDLRLVEVADVYKGDAMAGTLTRLGEGGTAFTYSPGYLDACGPAVASTLPLRSQAFVTRSGAVPAFFAGLLPEGARLQAVVTAVRTSADDELSLLLAVADDAIGDVTVIPAGAPPRPVPHTRSITEPQAVSFDELFALSIDPSGRYLDRAVPGVQEKLSSAVVSFPIRRRSTPSILKLRPAAFPRIVENESFFLNLAERCGFQVPAHEVIADREGTTGLAIERFDRVVHDGGIIRIGQEDACQFLDVWPADKYRVTINEIAERIADLASSPQAAILQLVEQVAFAYAIGNSDLHGKNISLQWDRRSRLVAPTPLYDVASTIPYPLDQRMALRIDGRDDNLHGRYLVDFAQRFRLPSRLVRRRLERIIGAVGDGIGEIHRIGLPEPMNDRMGSEIGRRLDVLQRFE